MSTKETVATAPGITSERAGGVPPLVDPAALRGLAEDVGPETAASFSRAFVRLWPRRRDSLIAALGQDDYGAAHDAVLSLRTSSAMVGASRLAGLAGQLEQCLRAEGTAAAARILPAILECGPHTLSRLSNDSSVSPRRAPLPAPPGRRRSAARIAQGATPDAPTAPAPPGRGRTEAGSVGTEGRPVGWTRGEQPEGGGPDWAGLDGADQTGAFEGAYREHASEVCAYLRARDVEDPEAAAQEVFLALYLSLRKARGGPRKLRTRIFAIAHDLAADFRRRRLRSPVEIEYDPAEDLRVVGSPEDQVLGNGQILLEGLPWDYREVLALRVIADLSAEATAWVMGRSPGAVKQLQRRALARLNDTVAQQPTAEGQ